MTAIPDSANGLLVTAPESVRERYRGLRGGDRMNGLAECRPAGGLVERSAPAALNVFCQIFVGRFGVSFSPFERLFLGRFGFGQSCGLSVIA